MVSQTSPAIEGLRTNSSPPSDVPSAWDCKYKNWYFLQEATGEVVEYDCKMWSCLKHSGMMWFRWMKRASHIPWTLMLTLTHVPRDPTQERKVWHRVRRYLASQGMRTYLKVTEFGSLTHMKHYHVIIEPVRFISVWSLSVAVGKAGLGTIVYVSSPKPEWTPRDAVEYVLKYCFKDYTSTRLPKGFRRVTCSRNVPSWGRVSKDLGFSKDPQEDSAWKLVKRSRGKVSETLKFNEDTRTERFRQGALPLLPEV